MVDEGVCNIREIERGVKYFVINEVFKDQPPPHPLHAEDFFLPKQISETTIT